MPEFFNISIAVNENLFDNRSYTQLVTNYGNLIIFFIIFGTGFNGNWNNYFLSVYLI